MIVLGTVHNCRYLHIRTKYTKGGVKAPVLKGVKAPVLKGGRGPCT